MTLVLKSCGVRWVMRTNTKSVDVTGLFLMVTVSRKNIKRTLLCEQNRVRMNCLYKLLASVSGHEWFTFQRISLEDLTNILKPEDLPASTQYTSPLTVPPARRTAVRNFTCSVSKR